MATAAAGTPPALNATLARKLAKVQELGPDLTPELLEALRHTSTFYGPNSVAARRTLRGELERRAVTAQSELLAAFDGVAAQLNALEADVEAMRADAAHVAARLSAARAAGGAVATQAGRLGSEKSKLEQRAELASRFLRRFQLAPDEQAALRGPPSDPAFFRALARLAQVQSDCRQLLRAGAAHQRAALEVAEAMRAQQNAAFDRLFRATGADVREVLERDAPEPPAQLCTSMRALMERPALLQAVLEEAEAARAKVVVRRFLDALTRGGGGARPIEVHAHDPLRYAGDMLAHLHQAVASEHELLQLLFAPSSLSAPFHPPPTSTSSSTSITPTPTPTLPVVAADAESDAGALPAAVKEQLTRSLGKVFDAACRPFRARLDQIMSTRAGTEDGALVLYRLAHLLDLYRRTATRLLPPSALLPTTLAEARRDALAAMHAQLRSTGEALTSAAPHASADLAVPAQVLQHATRLGELLQVLEASLVPPEEREAEAAQVLASVVEPLLRVCSLAATGLGVSDMAVFLLNCLSAIQAVLAPYPFAVKRSEALGAMMDAHLETLVEEETSAVLSASGISGKLSALHFNARQATPAPLATLAGLDGRSLAAALRHFEGALFERGALALPHAERLQQVAVRARARRGVAQLLASAYAVLHAAILDPANQYENPASLVRYTPEQFLLLCA